MNEDCLKLTTYFGERDRTPGGLLSDELMNIYGSHQLQASILLRGAEGFGRLQHLHTDRLLSLSERPTGRVDRHR
jgi:PII-like signaling protein